MTGNSWLVTDQLSVISPQLAVAGAETGINAEDSWRKGGDAQDNWQLITDD